jgi:hypothetical protein
MPAAKPLLAVLPAFLVTRVAIFFAATVGTDSWLYYRYAAAARTSSVAELYRSDTPEYPQLAVAFAAGAAWVADRLPDGAERLIATRGGVSRDVGTARFQVALGLLLFAIDVGMFLGVARWAKLLDPDDPRTQTWRLGVYVAGMAALGPVLYDRLDLVVGAVALLALAALASGRTVVAYGVLTCGVGFKLVPVLLFPVFVAAAAVARGGRFWPAAAREAASASLVLATWPLSAVLFGGGDRAFGYFVYHATRGPDVGAACALPLHLLADVEVGYGFGGCVVLGPAADGVAKAAAVVAAVAVAAAALVAVRAVRRAAPSERLSAVAGGCVLVWLTFMLTNKVASLQYFLWVAPLVPLLALRTRADRRWAVGFVVAGVLATLTFPYLWPLIHGEPDPDRPGVWAGPTAAGLALLLARWGVVVALIAALAGRLRDESPHEQTA